MFALSWRSIRERGFNALTEPLLLMSGAVLLLIHILISFWPTTFAYYLVHDWKRTFFPGSLRYVSGFYSYLDRMYWKRKSAFVLLLLFVLIFITANTFLIGRIFFTHLSAFLLDDIIKFTGAIVGSSAIITIFFVYTKKPPHFVHVDHGRAAEVQTLLDELAITAGIPIPSFAIVKLNVLTAFTLVPAHSQKPTIYLTVGLLNHITNEELRAVLAHELGHIISGRVYDELLFRSALGILRGCAALFSLLLLSNVIGFYALALWIPFFVVILFCGTISRGWRDTYAYYPLTGFLLINPPYAFVNFLSYVLIYFFTAQEEYYADLQAVALTRYPEGLAAALTSIASGRAVSPHELPAEVFHLVFAGPAEHHGVYPQPQPKIARRLDTLAVIDKAVHEARPVSWKRILHCPHCRALLRELRTHAHYGQEITIDTCPRCCGIWFDDIELYYIADLIRLCDACVPQQQILAMREYICPRCHVGLTPQTFSELSRPHRFHVCPSCNGVLADADSVTLYGTFRKERQAAQI